MKKFSITILFILCFCVFAAAQDPQNKTGAGSGSGKGNGTAAGNEKVTPVPTTPIRILAKRQARYTEAARQNNEQGFVTLRVTFLSSGEIGAVSVVSGLAYGLTEQAIAAAKEIKFEPAKKNGQPISTMKTVVFSFIIYVKESDIKTKAAIIFQPKPEYPAGENFKKMRGTVKLRITLTSFGAVMINEVSGDLPKEFQDKAVEAAKKIIYEPAIDEDDQKATTDREIEYEFKPAN